MRIGLLISGLYVGDIIHISPTYRQNITQLIFFTTPQLDEKSSFNPDGTIIAEKKLHFEFQLKLHFSSSRYYPNIIQISSRDHQETYPEIIQKSSKNNLEFIQISTSRHQFLQPPNLVKIRVFIQIWHDYCRWKLHF